nr:hypothetical protein [Tanacetum cinerariifolium]
MTLISSFTTIEESADEHEICDGYLTEKEQQQLLLDEEALREALKEEARAEKRARAEKEWKERMKKKLMMSYSGWNFRKKQGLKKRARAEKEWKERMKEEEAHDELFRATF